MKNYHVVSSTVAGAVLKALMLFTLIGCSSRAQAADAPTENQGANAMDAKIRAESNGLLRLAKFTKTNGQKANVSGIATYTMDCSVETIAVQDCAMTGFPIGGGWDGTFGAMKAEKKAAGMDQFNPFGAAYAGYKQVAKDAKMTFTTTMHFDLTERGWRTGGRLPADKPFVADLKAIADAQATAEADEWANKAETATNPQERGACYQKAFSLYQNAADAGNVGAMVKVGAYFMMGEGIPKDGLQAFKWFQKAANAGNIDGMCGLGACFSEGLGVPKDDAQAFKWFDKAANAGNTFAMANLGFFYYRGKGVPTDYAQSSKWFRKAVDAGNKFAITKISSISAANLRGISQAAIVWSAEHNDDLPPHMAVLVANKYSEPGQFVRPGSVTSPMTPTTKLRPEEWQSISADVDAHCDYVYVGKGLKNEANEKIIVAYEKPWTAKGLTVGFGDAHAEWVTPDKLPGVLQRDATARGGTALSISLPPK